MPQGTEDHVVHADDAQSAQPSSTSRPSRKRNLSAHLSSQGARAGARGNAAGRSDKKPRNALVEIVNGRANQKRAPATQRGSRVATRGALVLATKTAAATSIQKAYRAWKLRGGHFRLSPAWVEIETWEETMKRSHPPNSEIVERLSSTRWHPHFQREDEPAIAQILVLSDIVTCEKARCVCSAWRDIVDNEMCDRMFQPLQKLYVNPSFPYIHRVALTMRTSEGNFMVSPEDQLIDIGQINRELFVNFLVDIQEKLVLSEMTLSLAMNYIDRFISTTCVSTNKLLLLGVTSLFIASKFEEVDRIPMMMFLEVTDHTCTVQEVQEMELAIVRNLGWRLASPTAISFLQYLSCLPIDDSVVMHYAQYLAELSYQSRSFTAYKPSEIASAALFLSLEMLNPELLATICNCKNLIVPILHYMPKDVRRCMEDLQQVLYTVDSSHCTSIKRKYSKECFSHVGTLFSYDDDFLERIARERMLTAAGAR